MGKRLLAVSWLALYYVAGTYVFQLELLTVVEVISTQLPASRLSARVQRPDRALAGLRHPHLQAFPSGGT